LDLILLLFLNVSYSLMLVVKSSLSRALASPNLQVYLISGVSFSKFTRSLMLL